MKKLFVTMFCLGMAAPLFADGTNQLADEKSRVSYAIGMMTGGQWKAQDIDFDPEIYARGIKDALTGEIGRHLEQSFHFQGDPEEDGVGEENQRPAWQAFAVS